MDISIYDNYSGAKRDFELSTSDDGFRTCDSLLAVICLEGKAVFQLGKTEYEVKRHTFLVIAPKAMFRIKESNSKFRMDVLRVGESLFEIANDAPLKMHLNHMMYENPLYKLSEIKTKMFHFIHLYLSVLLKEKKNKYRNLIIYEYIKVLFWEACNIITEDMERLAGYGPEKMDITQKFFRSLDRHFKEKKTVSFYAMQLGITAKHLSQTLKKATGKLPSAWIEDYSLMEAKKLLRHSDNTIQEISYDLNFATPSHFSKFFKEKTGMTPKEFRKESEITI